MKTTPYDAFWNDAKNWRWHLVYICKEDPRIIVPKKPTWMGRTLNFAHRKAFVVLFFTLLAVVIPFTLHGHISNVSWWILFFVVMVGIILFYYCVKLYEK